MVYCPNCGKQNPDDAKYCNNCGVSLVTGRRDANKEWEDRCGNECSGRGRSGAIFWGIIVVLIGLWILFEFGIQNISGLPAWIYDISWGWIFGVVIGLAVLVLGLRILFKQSRRQ